MEKLHIGSSRKRVRIEKVCDENEDDHLTDMFNDAQDRFVDRLGELTKMRELLLKYVVNLQFFSSAKSRY